MIMKFCANTEIFSYNAYYAVMSLAFPLHTYPSHMNIKCLILPIQPMSMVVYTRSSNVYKLLFHFWFILFSFYTFSFTQPLTMLPLTHTIHKAKKKKKNLASKNYRKNELLNIEMTSNQRTMKKNKKKREWVRNKIKRK